MLNDLFIILDLACGRPIPEDQDLPARRLQIALTAIGASVVLGAVWGLAAGSTSGGLAAANLFKLPLIVLLSAVSALPAGLLTWKLSGATCRASDLLLGFAASIFSATLVLAVLSPIVALYEHSSVWIGPIIAPLTAFAALGTGGFIAARYVYRTAPEAGRGPVLFSASAMHFTLLATVIQLIALASPILPTRTVFDRGIDRLAPVSAHAAR